MQLQSPNPSQALIIISTYLFLEGALECVEEVAQSERADCAGRERVGGRREDGVDEAALLTAVAARDDLARRLCNAGGESDFVGIG